VSWRIAVTRRLRLNRPLTAADLGAERIGSLEDVLRAKEEAEGLGLFVRSLVGLDREAAKEAFAKFLAGKTLNANQIEFVNLVIEHLTEHGSMDPAMLYESPYTDFHPQGVDGLFGASHAGELVAVLEDVRRHATL
jgi:type I restriction enzyme R subunit